jgi:hypothetical protein
MPRMCVALPRSERLLPALLGALCALLACAGCGPQNGVVGRELAATGSAGNSGQAPTYRTDFDSNAGEWEAETSVEGASTGFGVPIAQASDPSTAELVFPGHANDATSTDSGPKYLTQIGSSRTFGFGTYRTRIQFGTCHASEDVVNAALGYFRDETDANQNGLTDEEEIDVQFLCGTPHRLYLTVFTDYESDTQFRKLARAIDFATGDVFDTLAPDQETFALSDNVKAWLRRELFSAGTFYVTGFEWHAHSLRFFIELDGVEQTLWTLSDAARIPQRPVTFLYNLWHSDTHWYPANGAAAFPAEDVVMHVDWFEYYAE